MTIKTKEKEITENKEIIESLQRALRSDFAPIDENLKAVLTEVSDRTKKIKNIKQELVEHMEDYWNDLYSDRPIKAKRMSNEYFRKVAQL